MPTSRKSSKRSSSKKNNNNNNTTDNSKFTTDIKSTNKMNKAEANTSGFLLTVIIQGLILYYLYNLESIDCNCIRDWRHNYIKYFAIFLIVYSAINIIIVNMPRAFISIGMIIIVFQLINLYAFFTYVGDLNETKCKCAVEKQPFLNSAMNVLRWVQFIAIVMGLLVIIWLMLFMQNMLPKIIESRK